MRRGKNGATRKSSIAATSDNLKPVHDGDEPSFRIDSVIGKSDSSSSFTASSSLSAGGKSNITSISISTGGKSNISALTTLTGIGSLSKKKKIAVPPTNSKAMPQQQQQQQLQRPLWLTTFYIFITVGSLLGILWDRSSDDSGRRHIIRQFRRKQYMIPLPDEFASVRRDPGNETPPEHLLPAPTNEYHVFHIAPVSNLGNSLLNNILMGMFDSPDELFSQVSYKSELDEFEIWQNQATAPLVTVTVVSQTNETDILVFEKKFSKDFPHIFFVALKSPSIPDCLAPPENMICFEYNDMVYQNQQERSDVIQRVTSRLQTEFPYFSKIKFDTNRMSLRLDGMEKAITEMLAKPANEVDAQYGIHGQQPIETLGVAPN